MRSGGFGDIAAVSGQTKGFKKKQALLMDLLEVVCEAYGCRQYSLCLGDTHQNMYT